MISFKVQEINKKYLCGCPLYNILKMTILLFYAVHMKYTNNQIAERFCQNLKERVSGLKVKKKTKIFVKPKNYLPFTKIRIKNPQEQLLSIF